MQYLFGVWPKLKSKLSQARHIFLCMDFDGTITPIKPHPQKVNLDENLRLVLQKMVGKKSLLVGIISGRALKDIQQKVALKGLIFAGNHGLEISYQNKNFICPQAQKNIPVISQIAQQLTRALDNFAGIILEKKRLTLSLHYRLLKKDRLPRLRRLFFQVIKPYLNAQKIKLTYGKKVWEIRPPLKWDKARALLWLFKKLAPKDTLPIYLGDDLTDEAAFRQVNRIGGISIFVGRKKTSSAKYYLKNTKDTQRFLKEILQAKTRKLPPRM